jgi:hypothetical protein
MNRRSFLKNSIGALLFSALSSNKVLASVVNSTPKDSLNILLYLIQSKNGDWKVRATKWTNLNKDKLRYSQYDISTFKPLGIYDNSEIMDMQRKYWKQYNCKGKLVPVNHIQCTKNGFNTPVSKVATFESRSKAGMTNIINNHIQSLGKEYGPIFGKKYGKNNIWFARTKEGIKNQVKSASMKVYQLDFNKNLIKLWNSLNDAKRAGYHAGHISECCNGLKPQYKGYLWKFK